jgi:transporter family protein
MSILLALLAAVFASFTAILAKIGIENVNSNLATAVRTVVVVLMAFLMVVITGQTGNLSTISMHALLFLILSGLATGLSWLFYFKAIQMGDVSKVAPIDNSSIVLTLILSFLFLGEPAPIPVVFGGIFISIGTFVLIGKNNKNAEKKKFRLQPYLYFAVLAAIFAALTSILAKIGIQNVDSNVATFVRTVVIIIFSWGIVFFQGNYKDLKKMTKKSFSFLIMSGIATGLSWLCFYGALALGKVSVVTPIDKSSIVLTIVLSFLLLKEKPTRYKIAGAILITIGTALLIV